MENYTTEQIKFITLIQTEFKIKERIQKGITYLDFEGSGTTRKEVATELGIDDSLFGKMIKPGYPSALTKHIGRLRHRIELREKEAAAKINQLKKTKKILYVCLFAALGFVIIIGHSLINTTIPDEHPTWQYEEGIYFIDQEPLKSILALYGENIAYKLAERAVETHKNIKAERSNIEYHNNSYYVNSLKLIKDQRDFLQKFDFVWNGKNLVKYMDESITLEMRKKQFKQGFKYVLNIEDSELLRKTIYGYVGCLQRQSIENIKIILDNPTNWNSNPDFVTSVNECVLCTYPHY